ncbi:FAD-dependent oxidoreductase [Humisphaera borealis]|uniref:FAD-dependent oxidoreductase n=1 Tax=Humisphaera borealis TaxID=2807512 RepID=A0A7M2X295_9BACT|nr:FAD-dependent oxidoreductase [Humisphaera borealis]QOV91868.1 FAD-dependent oxidoreductase [Humisphaera borealis]
MTTLLRRLFVAVLLVRATTPASAADATRVIEADLLVVGGNESAVAAAVQASRLGVKKVVLVNDIDWLGGQFSAEGVGNVDEWTTVNGKRVDFPRSGLFLEVVQAIQKFNRDTYGTAEPANSFCARLTIEPAAAAKIFDALVEPEIKSGRLRIERGYTPVATGLEGSRLASVTFARGEQKLQVTARLTIDASDWGDVIRLSGAKYSAGPDPRSRFNEPSAPTTIDESNRREMNPLTYCVVVRGKGDQDDPSQIVPKPPGFDVRRYFGVSRETKAQFTGVGWPKKTLFMNVPAFADTKHEAGPYSPPVNVYTHRRVVDAVHRGLPYARECLFFNWPVQDYPLDVWPKPVCDLLEATEKGASLKNIVDLSPSQRQIVFEDAKRHALGMLHHLQTIEPRFARLKLTDEFGTPDRLPPKPYIREGLRLEAMTMLREQDLRTPHEEPRWAKFMPADGVFGFQFNIDFHPTRRQFLNDDAAGPWATIHTATRNWSTHTDRGVFPLRGLIPVERDGLLGASKNIGYSSIVSSALRLHGQMMLCGQASGAVASLCLAENIQPRQLSADGKMVRRLQKSLADGSKHPGVLLWPYHDLPVGDPAFESATLLTQSGIWEADPDSVMFSPNQPITDDAWKAATDRAKAYLKVKEFPARPASRGEAVRAIFSAIDFEAIPLRKDKRPE